MASAQARWSALGTPPADCVGRNLGAVLVEVVVAPKRLISVIDDDVVLVAGLRLAGLGIGVCFDDGDNASSPCRRDGRPNRHVEVDSEGRRRRMSVASLEALPHRIARGLRERQSVHRFRRQYECRRGKQGDKEQVAIKAWPAVVRARCLV